MKRGAERQLTKDSDDDDNDVEEIQDPQGFQKADESVLANRQIRALPRRAFIASKTPAVNGTPPASAPDAENGPASPPRFAGFVGFGAGTTASNPFTFAAQQPPASVSAPSASDPAFKPSQPTTASPFFGVPTPPSLGVDSSTPKPTASPRAETDVVAFKYFKSLRGLNVSFLSAISAAVEKDPFFDVANLVESYKNLRTTIQSEFDGSSQPSTGRGSATTSSSIFGTKAPPDQTTSLFSMPKSLGGSAEVPPKLPSASEGSTKTGGFTFPPFVPPSSSAPTQLPLSFTSKPSEELPKSALPSTASKTSISMSSTPSTSGISFAAPPSAENATPTPIPSSSSHEPDGFSTDLSSRSASAASSFGSSSVSNVFGSTKPTNAFGTTDAVSKPTSVFGGSIFGGSSLSESNKLPLFAPPPSDSKDTPKTDTALFGSVAATSSSSTSIFGSSSDKSTGFFGSTSAPKTSAFTFGKPGGSIGNPVGFGFGSSSPSAGDITAPGSSGSGFNFGAPSAKPSERLLSPPTTDWSTESTPQPDAEHTEEGGDDEATKLLPSHTHDAEGEGEEDEETVHVVRCKVYRLCKSEDKSEWKDLGIGMFRLKKHKATNVRRALMRNSNTGRILINFRINGSLKPSLAKTSISFIGYENNTPTSFRIRVKTEEQAGELKQAMEQEIAAVQAE